MKIVVLAQRVPYPPNKGEKIRTFYQLQYLRELGHSIIVFAVKHEPEDHQSAQALEEALGIEVVLEPVGFLMGRLIAGLFSARTLSVCNFYTGRLQQRFDHSMSGNDIDVVLCTGSAMASYVFANASLVSQSDSGPTLIMDFMDLDSDKWAQYSRHSRFPMTLVYRREALLLSRYEKRINSVFTHCLFVSQNEVTLFQSQDIPCPARVHVVGNGVDMHAFKPVADITPIVPSPGGATHDKVPELVFSGVMNYLPNEDAVCWFVDNLWATIRQRWPDARFTIVGMSPSDRFVRLGELQGIEVTGKVESVLPYFHRATIFVAPFRLARGLQNKILQAFASGLPVVTSSSGAEGIACWDGVHLLIADTAEDVLQAIVRLVEKPQVGQVISNNALALVRENYSWTAQNAALQNCLPTASDA